MAKKRGNWLILPLALVSAALLLVYVCFGSARLSLEQVIAALGYRFFGLGEKVGNHGAIVELRLWRTMLAYLTGAALSVSGAAMQAVFGNALADPHIMGVSSGAALGAAIATVFSLQTTMLGLSAVSLCAFAGGLAAAFAVMAVARINGRAGTTGLLLAGVAMGAFFSALLSGLLALNRGSAEAVYMWTMGSFSAASDTKVSLAAATLAFCLALLLLFSRELNLLLTGESEAASLGVHVRFVRGAVLLISTMLTAVVVSMSGVIGFVGLMMPHAARRISGPKHQTLFPISALLGGIFLMTADTLARSVARVEIPVGVLTSLIGGPFFLFLLRRMRTGKRRSEHAWMPESELFLW